MFVIISLFNIIQKLRKRISKHVPNVAVTRRLVKSFQKYAKFQTC